MSPKVSNILAIDWLQMTFKGALNFYEVKNDLFEVNILEKTTSEFKFVADVYFLKVKFFSCCFGPKSEILPPDMILTKVYNECLYTENYIHVLQLFEQIYSLKFNNITRFDICLDFISFNKQYKPENLIKNYLSQKIIKSGKTKFYCIGENNQALNFSYLRFGMKSSVINTYLYNKSLEMQENTTKPYIMDNWNKLINPNNSDVWRLEFSVKSPKLELRDEYGSIEYKFTHYDDMNLTNLKVLFQVLTENHFCFYANDGKVRKDRNRKLNLFNFENTELVKHLNYTKSDGSKTDKLLINRILKNDAMLRIKAPELANNILFDFKQFAESKNLNELFKKSMYKYLDTEQITLLKKTN